MWSLFESAAEICKVASNAGSAMWRQRIHTWHDDIVSPTVYLRALGSTSLAVGWNAQASSANGSYSEWLTLIESSHL
jgi:hypothetical protein